MHARKLGILFRDRDFFSFSVSEDLQKQKQTNNKKNQLNQTDTKELTHTHGRSWVTHIYTLLMPFGPRGGLWKKKSAFRVPKNVFRIPAIVRVRETHPTFLLGKERRCYKLWYHHGMLSSPSLSGFLPQAINQLFNLTAVGGFPMEVLFFLFFFQRWPKRFLFPVSDQRDHVGGVEREWCGREQRKSGKKQRQEELHNEMWFATYIRTNW